MHNGIPTTSLELHGSRQTSDLVPIFLLSLHIGDYAVLPRRNLLRQVDFLRQGRLTLLDRALQIDVLDRVAEIGGLLDDGDQAILDLKVHDGALSHVLGERARGCDCELLASAYQLVCYPRWLFVRRACK